MEYELKDNKYTIDFILSPGTSNHSKSNSNNQITNSAVWTQFMLARKGEIHLAPESNGGPEYDDNRND